MSSSIREIARRLPFVEGDTLLVSSDVLGLALHAEERGERFTPDELIESFQRRLGARGTLLFPTFNFDFCEGRGFDVRKTLSLTGALSRAALRRPDFKRTRHPIHSFAVWGRLQGEFCTLDNKSSFGVDSPFDLLYRLGATALIIGLGYQGAFTFVHYVEEREGAGYRYLKEFTGPYTDEHGHAEIRTYALYVRDLKKGVESWVDPMGEILEKKGIARHRVINGVAFKWVDLRRAYDEIARDIHENNGRNLHRIG